MNRKNPTDLSKRMRKMTSNPQFNFFWKKSICWSCEQDFHKLILTKFYGCLCRNCYLEKIAQESNNTKNNPKDNLKIQSSFQNYKSL